MRLSSNFAAGVLLLMGICGTARADKPPPADEDFLEYLGGLDDEEDWALFAEQESATDARKPANQRPEDDAKPAPQQAAPKQK